MTFCQGISGVAAVVARKGLVRGRQHHAESVNSGLVPPRAGHAACACRPSLLGILLSFARQYSPPPASPVPKFKLQTSGASTAKKR
ncbi:hypothetical protein CBS147346_8464 [Aspergillus niger]|nr:hypothetical protein CBS147346_8464 [Aspergillus niger]